MTGKTIMPAAFALLLLGAAPCPAPPLTLIQDMLYQADGTKFHGTAYIQWKSFNASDTSVVQMQSITVRIVDGILRVYLVPTTTASSGAYYQVRFNSNGRTQFVENWAVPPSATALRLRDVRIQGPYQGVTSPPVNSAIIIGDVTGLRDELDSRPTKATGFTPGRVATIDTDGALEGVLGNPGDCVRVDGTSTPCIPPTLYPVFVDSEVPTGSVNGTNFTFMLSTAPAPGSSLRLYRNGLLQQPGTDYLLTGSTVLFVAGAEPATGDVLGAWYRVAETTTTPVSFVEGEIPSGLLNGTNNIFALGSVTNPTSSVQIFRNGLLLRETMDYAISGSQLTFLAGATPQAGDFLQASYRR